MELDGWAVMGAVFLARGLVGTVAHIGLRRLVTDAVQKLEGIAERHDEAECQRTVNDAVAIGLIVHRAATRPFIVEYLTLGEVFDYLDLRRVAKRL